ncbi:cytochrome P450 3A13 [Colletotrichum simmondsii]|uniref:Cytochrome P450 3A13 n=1 Tax=Colletotrichum simmondsii TaxID=703756 RepID=A0A135RZA9_9PEZI|nr:cytochrome P450 3A13 [Colletotrichum simmondsii]
MPWKLLTPELIPVTRNQIVLLACIFIAALWIRSLRLQATAKIPGPWHLKLTSLPVKHRELFGQKREWVHKLHLRCGPVVQVAYNEVSFASYTAAKQIYGSGNKDFPKTELYSLFQQDGHISDIYSNLFTALDSDTHSSIRRHLADRYSNSSVLRPQVIEMIDERAEAFGAVCAASDTVDIYFYLHAYALDCVTGMLFHPHRTNSLVDAGDQQMVQLLSYSKTREVSFLNHYLPLLSPLWAALSPKQVDLERGSGILRKFVQDSLDTGDHSEFTVARKLLESNEVSRPLAEAECLDHIGAGIETTGDTLCWLIWELSQPQHEGRVQKLHNELVEAWNNRPLHDLPYLNAVVHEGLRLFAPGTMSLPRYASKQGAFIDGYFIPKNTIVACNSFSMHRLDESTFPDACAFVPERWLDSEDNTDRQRLFFAFGLGPRTCIGRQ